MDAEERLRLDYDQTTELVRALMDVRLRLLALVPTTAGVAVGLLGSPRSAGELLGVGLLGLLATVGILLYELRNTQVFDAMLRHARSVERLLGLDAAAPTTGPEGILSVAPVRPLRFFGLLTVGQEQAVGIGYGAALGGWAYLVAWGALLAAGFSGARGTGGVIGALTTIAVILEVTRIERRAGIEDEPSEFEGRYDVGRRGG